jgi:hypothetical protein
LRAVRAHQAESEASEANPAPGERINSAQQCPQLPAIGFEQLRQLTDI